MQNNLSLLFITLVCAITHTNAMLLSTKDLKCGFLGCGTIAAAIATGLASSSDEEATFSHFHVSKRSASKSAKLLSTFGPDKVTICESGNNQEILGA